MKNVQTATSHRLKPGAAIHRENGYIAQPIPIPTTKNKNRLHKMYFARSIGFLRLKNPNAIEIIAAKSNSA